MALAQYRSGIMRALSISIAAGAVIAIAGHLLLHTQHDPLTYTGPLLILDHLFDFSLAAALLAVCFSAGRFVLDRVGLKLATPLEGLLLSLVLGTAILALIYLAAGALGLLWTPAVLGLPVAIAALTFRQLQRLPHDLRRAIAFVRERSGHPLLAATVLGVLALVGLVMVVQAIPPPTDWDSLMYHLEIPKRFLEAGRIYTPEDNLHVGYIGLTHMLYLPLLAAASASGPAILSAFFALALGLAVFSLAERFLDGETASLSAAALWGSASLLLVAITPRIDVTLALYLTLAVHAGLAALERDDWRWQLGLAAVLLGLAMGIKLHAAAFILAMAPLLAWAALSRAESNRAALVGGLTVVGLGTFAAAPWLLKTWLVAGDPFYPLFGAHRILQPWLAELYGSLTAPASFGGESYDILGQAREPVDLVSLFLAPGRLTVEAEGAYYRLSWLLPLLVFWPLYWRKRALSSLVLVGALYLAIVILPQSTTNLRYLIPALPLLTIAATHIGLELSRTAAPERWLRPVAVLLVLATLYPSATVMRLWLRKSDVLGYVAGSTSGQEYLTGGFAYYANMVQAVNDRVPPDGKVLLFFEARGFYFEPEVIQDNVLTNWPLLAARTAEPGSCLGSSGITHILAANAAVNYYIRRGANPELFRGDLFPAFADRCLEPVHRGRGFILFRVKGRSRTGSR